MTKVNKRTKGAKAPKNSRKRSNAIDVAVPPSKRAKADAPASPSPAVPTGPPLRHETRGWRLIATKTDSLPLVLRACACDAAGTWIGHVRKWAAAHPGARTLGGVSRKAYSAVKERKKGVNSLVTHEVALPDRAAAEAAFHLARRFVDSCWGSGSEANVSKNSYRVLVPKRAPETCCACASGAGSMEHQCSLDSSAGVVMSVMARAVAPFEVVADHSWANRGDLAAAWGKHAAYNTDKADRMVADLGMALDVAVVTSVLRAEESAAAADE